MSIKTVKKCLLEFSDSIETNKTAESKLRDAISNLNKNNDAFDLEIKGKSVIARLVHDFRVDGSSIRVSLDLGSQNFDMSLLLFDEIGPFLKVLRSSKKYCDENGFDLKVYDIKI